MQKAYVSSDSSFLVLETPEGMIEKFKSGTIRVSYCSDLTRVMFTNNSTGKAVMYCVITELGSSVDDDTLFYSTHEDLETALSGFFVDASVVGGSDDGPVIIKMKYITGTTPSLVNSTTYIPHGLVLSKIIGLQVLILLRTTEKIPIHYTSWDSTETVYYVDCTIMDSNIEIRTGNSATDVLSKPVDILITYLA